MGTDSDFQLLNKVAQNHGFLHCLLHEDELEDWTLARDLGELLIRIAPDEAIGHAIVARSARHLGDLDRARKALEECRVIPMETGEAITLRPLLEQELRHLS